MILVIGAFEPNGRKAWTVECAIVIAKFAGDLASLSNIQTFIQLQTVSSAFPPLAVPQIQLCFGAGTETPSGALSAVDILARAIT